MVLKYNKIFGRESYTYKFCMFEASESFSTAEMIFTKRFHTSASDKVSFKAV